MPEESSAYGDDELVELITASDRRASPNQTESGIARWTMDLPGPRARPRGRSAIQEYFAAPGMVSSSRQYQKEGGFEQANKDFDAMTRGTKVEDRGGGLRTAELSDGSKVIVRPNSSGGQPWHMRGEALVQRSWTAVPVEKGRHVEPEDAVRLASAIRQEAPAPCYAFATEPTGAQPRAYEAVASEDGLLEFSHQCVGLSFILVPLDLAFALLFTSEDHNVYAGPSRFVQAALGTSIPDVRTAFHRYADDPWWKGRLLEVHKRYESFG